MNINKGISDLPEIHALALQWFVDNCGTEQLWPQPLKGSILLASKAKGIYKPKWSEYALSIRHSIQSPYKDRLPSVQQNGEWTYLYFQENTDISARDKEYTNRGLL